MCSCASCIYIFTSNYLNKGRKGKKGTRKEQKRGEKIRRKGLERKKRERAEGYFFISVLFFISRGKDNLRRVWAVGNGGERWFGNEERGDDEPRVLRPPRRARRTAVRAGAPSKSVPDCIIERE